MPETPIPFANNQATGYDSLGGAPPIAMNVVMEGTGAIRRRPGIRSAGLTDEVEDGIVDAAGITGITETIWGDLLVVGGEQLEFSVPIGKSVYRVSGGEATELTTDALLLEGEGRPVFANTEMITVITAGAAPIKVDLNSVLALLGGSPPQATHVISANLRLLLNDALVFRTQVHYSSPAIGTTTYAGLEEWNGAGDSDAFNPETKADPVIGVYSNANELWIPGTETLQVYAPDESFVFAPVMSLALGSTAPYSFTLLDERYAFLDHKRRFVISSGRAFEPISGAIQRTLDEMETVTDCYGYRVEFGPVDSLVWSLPSSGVTYAFQKSAGWSQWAGWDGTAWTECPILSYYRRPSNGQPLVGLSTGELGELSFDASDDMGETIRCLISSGFQNHNTNKQKWCRNVRLALRRGGQSSSGGTIVLSYQDRDGPLVVAREITTGEGTDTEIVVDCPSLGTYTHRQWWLEFSGAAPFVLVSAIEQYEILEN